MKHTIKEIKNNKTANHGARIYTKTLKNGTAFILLLLMLFNLMPVGLLNNKVYGETLQITEEDRKAGEILKVDEIVVGSRVTGIVGFDEDNSPGNDKDQYNNIVRSFDKVMWNMFITMGTKEGAVEDVNTGILKIEAELPDLQYEGTPTLYKWDLEGMHWAKNVELTENGRKFTANLKISIADAAQQEFILAMDVLGAPNGMEITPKITVSLEGNEESDKKSIILNNQDESKLNSKVIVSAKPALDVLISKTSLNTNGNYNVETGQKVTEATEDTNYGNMQGYGIGIGLFQTNTNKGLTGIEVPYGDIKFDLTLNQETSLDPIFWDYNENMTTKTGKNNRTMLASNDTSLPYNKEPVANSQNKSCNNGGNWNIVQDENDKNKYHVTVSGYEFNNSFIFPVLNSSGVSMLGQYPGIRFFSTGYFETILQILEQEEGEEPIKNIKLTAEISNVNYKSLTNQTGVDNNPTNNSSVNNVDLYPSGGTSSSYPYEKRIWFVGANKRKWDTGDSSAIRGQKIEINTYIRLKDRIGGADILVKFDDKALEPRVYSGDKEYYPYRGDTMKFNVLYAAKFDGTGWTSDSEMQNTKMDDLQYFDTIEELNNAGVVCVGALLESTSGYLNRGNGVGYYYLPVTVKSDAEPGKVYQALNDVRYYDMNHIPDRTIQTHLLTTNINDYPARVWSYENGTYTKTKYNENGEEIGYHVSVYRGDSLLVIGAAQNIKIAREKEIYNLSLNENTAQFTVTPSIAGNYNIEGVDLKVKVTLPVGLTYICGTSNYDEPEIIKNNDGTTTLVWYKNNQTVNKSVGQITFETFIDEDTPNNKIYTISTSIEEKPKVVDGKNIYVIGNGRNSFKYGGIISNRTASTTITVENMGGYSTYKETETHIVEKGEKIRYKIVASNRKDEPLDTFQMLDILPHNGDGRGTEYSGTYTVESIDVKVLNSNKEEVTNHNIKLYLTENEDVRSQDAKTIDFSKFEEAESGSINKTITGFALKGTLPQFTKVVVEIVLKPENNMPSDKYINSATVQTNPNASYMSTKKVKVEVIKRYLDGRIWLDSNRNGIIDEGESFIKDVNVALLNIDGTPAKDINGNTMPSIRTNQDGYYKFEDMIKGDYKVKIEYEDKYDLTEKEAGDNIELNSKFNNNDQTDKITKLSASNNFLIKQEYVNAGLIIKGGNLIVHHYIMKPDGTKTTTKVKLPSEEDAADETQEGDVGNPYTTNKVNPIEYYEYVEDTGNTTGTFTVASETTPIEVIYYYRLKQYSYTVRYFDKDTGEEIKEFKTGEAKYYETEVEVSSEKIDIEKYEYDSSDVGKTEKEDKEKLTIGSNVEENVINLYYIKKKGTVITKYIDINTKKEIEEKESTTDKIDEIYTTIKKEIEEYVYVKDTENTTGKYIDGEIEVIYYYRLKQYPYTVNYYEKETGELIGPKTKQGEKKYLGTEIETEKEIIEIEGYEYDSIEPENILKIGKHVDKNVINIYYIRKKGTLVVKYKDIETGEEIEETITDEDGVGKDYFTHLNNIPGYIFVKDTENTEGKYIEGETKVIYYYRKLVFNLKLDKWVDSIIINGVKQKGNTFDAKDKVIKTEINKNKIAEADVKVVYKIRITNDSEVAGKVETLTEKIPEGLKFYQEDNSITWKEENGVLTTEDLKDIEIEPGKYAEISITLRWENKEENFGAKTNIASIGKANNRFDYEEKTKEDNKGQAEFVLAIVTGLDSVDKIILTRAVILVMAMTVFTGITMGIKKKINA